MRGAFRKMLGLPGFTLVELLTVIAVIGILAVLLIPAVSGIQERARRTVAQDKLRKIHAAYLAYTTDGRRLRTLDAESVHDWARVLAEHTGFNDPQHFILPDDPLTTSAARLPVVIATPPASGTGNWRLHPAFDGFPLSFAVANRLSPQAPPTTPLAWTRGLMMNGRWADESASTPGVYGSAGGHVLRLDGSVEFHEDLNEGGGRLLHYQTRQPTGNLRDALGPHAEILDSAGTAR